MRRAISDFSDVARDSDIAVVYYAGHGIEVDGVNYLVPVDATLARDFDVEDETVSLNRVLKAIESARRLRLVILDACRNSPFVESMKRASRAIGRGLARVEPTADTLVAFAAKAGSTASDGTGGNSPFTAALLEHIATPGLDIRLALGQVRDTVMASTSPRQEPFVYGSLGGRTISIVDAPAASAGPQGTTVPPQGLTTQCAEAVQSWRDIKNTTNIAVLEAFVRRYSDCFYADLATLRIAELRKSQQAAVTPAAPVAPVAPISPGPAGPQGKPSGSGPSASNCGHPHGDYVIVGIAWGDADKGLLIRAAPNSAAAVKGVIPAAATGLGVSNCQGGWCQVKYACQSGWAGARYLSERSAELYRVTGVKANDPDGLNVRTGPGATYARNGSIPFYADGVKRHSCYPDTADRASWCLVTYRDVSGWVANQFLTR
jgi:uncharacterized protein YraI